MKSIKFLAYMSFLLPLTAGPALAQGDIMFILDGSGSMAGRVDGTAKIETAKQALSGMLLDLPAGTRAGLMAYGHTRKDDCTDVQVLAPIGSTDAKGLVGKLQSIVAKGKTPIAHALEISVRQFSKADVNNTIVLVSDGLETCGGNPCQVAGSLAKKGFDVKVHVVGFDVDKKERKQLECIASVTGGKYFQADSTEGFNEAVSQVQEEVQVAAPLPPPPPPPEPAGPKEVFLDDFDGEDLGEHWEVLNPNPDAFIVEEGELLVINSIVADFAQENIENMFRLTEPLPKKDWTATVRWRIDFQTGKERVFFGLYDDKDNYLVSVVSTAYDPNSGHILFLSPTKASKGDITSSRHQVWIPPKDIRRDLNKGMAQGQPILLRLEKKRRAYSSAIKMEGVAESEWIELPPLKLLRLKGGLAIGLFQTQAGSGETSILVDWIKIEVPGK